MKIISTKTQEGRQRRRIRRLRTVAVFPTMLTLGNMLCGFAAIYFCMLGLFTADVDPSVKVTLNNRFIEEFLPTFISVAGFLIFLGMFFDMMDGRVARMTSGTTNFGGQLDSLADMVTFGVAPAMLIIALVTLETKHNPEMMVLSSRSAWMAGAIFATCAALRLARFNVEHAEGDLSHKSFDGLPSPAAAAVVASLIVLYEHVREVRGMLLVNTLPIVAIVAGILMVSRIRYVHVANTYLRGRRPFGYVIIPVLIFTLLLRYPAQTLASLTALYALTGPVVTLINRLRSRPVSARPVAEEAPDADQSGHGQRQA
jgi:CDP-diacylglycerol--serine O-phosphatidyltransferase